MNQFQKLHHSLATASWHGGTRWAIHRFQQLRDAQLQFRRWHHLESINKPLTCSMSRTSVCVWGVSFLGLRRLKKRPRWVAVTQAEETPRLLFKLRAKALSQLDVPWANNWAGCVPLYVDLSHIIWMLWEPWKWKTMF